MARIMEDHRLVLSSYVIDECYEVVERKKPSLIPALDRLFESIPFEMVHTPQILPKHGWFTIRDKDDEKADQPSVDVFKWPMTGNCFETVGFRHFSYRCRTMPIKTGELHTTATQFLQCSQYARQVLFCFLADRIELVCHRTFFHNDYSLL